MEFVNTRCRSRHLVSVILHEQAPRSILDDSKWSRKKGTKEHAISLRNSRGDFTNGYCKQMLLATKLFFSSTAGKKNIFTRHLLNLCVVTIYVYMYVYVCMYVWGKELKWSFRANSRVSVFACHANYLITVHIYRHSRALSLKCFSFLLKVLSRRYRLRDYFAMHTCE